MTLKEDENDRPDDADDLLEAPGKRRREGSRRMTPPPSSESVEELKIRAKNGEYRDDGDELR